MDVWNYILGYRNTLKSVFETWVVHIPFNWATIRSILVDRMSRVSTILEKDVPEAF